MALSTPNNKKVECPLFLYKATDGGKYNMTGHETNGIELKLSERLHLHVDRLAGLIGPRHIGRPSSLAAAAAYIANEFSLLGDTIERQTYEVDHHEVANLIVERKGSNRPQEIVILGAHYDTVAETPGADDNASAVAVLIEVARLLFNQKFQRTLRFVAFTCEEPPHFYTDTMGSQIYARQCRRSKEKIVGMLAMEMVGYFTTDSQSQALPPGIPRIMHWIFPRRGDFLASVGNLRSWRLVRTFRRGFKKASRLPLFSISLPEKVNEIRLSDNSSFWDQNYPAIMLTDTSFLRNPHYHLPSDTPDKLDYERMARVAIGIVGGLKQLAKREKGTFYFFGVEI